MKNEPIDFKELEKLLENPNDIAVICHINPDGDAIGALLGLGRALIARGRSVTLFSHDGVPTFFQFMLRPGDEVLDSSAAEKMRSHKFDAVIYVDSATKKRTGEAFFPMIDAAGTTICIDHHHTNKMFAGHNFIDGGASSACEILYRFFKSAGWPIPVEIAECLYMGIMYDTGRFMHSNTTPAVFTICSELVAGGVSPSDIANHVYKDRLPSSLRMLGWALSHMRTAADGRVAYAVAPRSVFRELGASDADTEGIVEALGAYIGCELHFMFTEGPDGLSRVSSRSAGRIKVSEICAMFGGGGHDFAAGIRTEKPLDEIVRLVIDEAVARVEKMRL